ncbi:OmpP1/FadL family transporter [Vibrio coralliilyticus]|uniref:OmpP1/FadL family transporter n=1 Tax=Vibrio coralliilyticus TaxID=190893 RepID=UPI00148E67F7|nr:outer membrane protein transport protein [Vibrio coralliilyticus]NOI28431.1 outer membrane protein transport protein [Vibrio coralliilyticus]NOI49371.1 outer membrane protein transport protein [Vibrio coralliilyticus]
MKTNKTLLSLAVAGGLLSASASVNAAGFQLAEYSATGLGRAYAGEAAMADNASAQWRNPAMLTYLEGTQISVGAIYVNPNVDVSGTINNSLRADSEDFADDAVIPNFYLSHQYSEQLVLGLALGTNYGMETNLGTDFSASHFGNEASVTTMETNLNAAYKLNEQFSFGGGIRYVIGEGSFGAIAPTHSPLSGRTLKYMEGDDTAWGWQLGAAWQINPEHRLGVTYKSAVDLKLSGNAKILNKTTFQVQEDTGSMDLTLPATLELASFHQLNEELAVHFSLNWTDWSSFQQLYADLDTLDSQIVKVENWDDNYRLAAGATYSFNEKLTLRTGIAYDTSAVSDKNRTITIPETDRTWLSLGASYEFTKQFTLDGGLTYILAKDATITESRGYQSDDEAQAVGGQFTGEVSGNIWLIGVQANYKF